MKRPICACALLGIMLLAGCKGTTSGKDTVEPCAGYAGGSVTIFPDITTDTQVRERLAELLNYAIIGEYQSAFDMLVIPDTTFVDTEDFGVWFVNSGIKGDFSLREDNRDKVKYVNVASGSASYDFYPEKQEDGTFKYRIEELCARDFQITIPTGIPATLDGVDITDYATSTEGTNTIYTIPQIADAAHSLVIDTVFTEPITVNIADCSKAVDVSQYLAAPKTLRKQLINDLASPTLANIQKVIISQDWEKFCKYFTPDKNMQEYQAHFYKGDLKQDTYNLELVETRDLELSDLDVHFTGYNTISVKFGTRWTWSDPDDVKFDKEGNFVSLNETRIKTMRIVNTLEFFYDAEKDKWYLNNIDTGSITLLSPGEEQWR